MEVGRENAAPEAEGGVAAAGPAGVEGFGVSASAGNGAGGFSSGFWCSDTVMATVSAGGEVAAAFGPVGMLGWLRRFLDIVTSSVRLPTEAY